MAQKPAIIIDNGSYITKAGFAGDKAPKVEFSTQVGRLRDYFAEGSFDPVKAGLKECYVGDEIDEKRGILQIKYPVQHGVIDKWDEMEKIWEHTFGKLEISSTEEHPIFLTEAACNPKATREKMAEVMFEKFNVPAVFVGIQGVLSLYASGCMVGTALSIGGGVTQVTPVDKGYAIPGASTCLKLGGHDLRQNLAKILMESGNMINSKNFLYQMEKALQKFCYVALDFDEEMKSNEVKQESYELPDGEVIKLQDEKFRCPELLFKPSLMRNLNEYDIKEGIHKVCFDTIAKCDSEIQPLLHKGIVLSGGSTLIPGLEKRLEKEVQGLVPTGTTVEVIAPEQRKNSVWIGGSILGGMATFKDMWITKEQYTDQGPSVMQKCPSA
ncbi:actin, clone 302-like isoform X2 [Dendronephthya gigantea]|uniref:actin, clone 302-like isoform X2 n=1 Tax=Dendronephthya gigantea TaxID=151771 RepID=UPI00106DC507|nr:actin, clone 302-like isoform X2 [Dendronephthya gigantea]